LPSDGPTVIADFGHLDGDVIDLSLLDANFALGGDQAFTFIGSAAFSADATGQLRYVDGFLQASVNAEAFAEIVIEVNGAPALVAADFVL
jgi:hypothetical protein